MDHAIPEVSGVMVVGALLTLVIVRQQQDAAAQRQTHESLAHFVRQVLTAQEEERNRVALELHDETTQDLLFICQRLARLAEGRDGPLPEAAAAGLASSREALMKTLAGLRRLSQGLRPRILDDLGLEAALEWLADQLREEHSIDVSVDVDAQLDGYPPALQLLLFRIAQEALRNVARHAETSQAAISVRRDADGMTMTITDDGRGFVVPPRLSDLAGAGKLGLAGMVERVRLLGGVLSIRSAPGCGSTIEVVLPAGAVDPARQARTPLVPPAVSVAAGAPAAGDHPA
jgi:signal transduction histidine kinase